MSELEIPRLVPLLGGQPKPLIDLYFADGNNRLDSRVTFTRASSGTYIDANGILRIAATNVARFDHDTSGNPLGLLIENARTSIARYSEQFDNAVYAKDRTTISANATVAPDGETTADEIIENTASGLPHGCAQTITIVADTFYVISLFVKANARFRGYINLASGADGFSANYNLTAGTIGAVAVTGTATAGVSTITAYPNGWYRVTVSGKTNATSTTALLNTYMLDAAGSLFYTGDGASSMYFWGEQCEAITNTASDEASSYIQTTTADFTRAADSALITDLSFINETAGTFILTGVRAGPRAGNDTILMMSNNASTNLHRIRFAAATATVDALTYDGTTFNVPAAQAYTPGVSFNIGYAYAEDDIALIIDGGTPTTDTSTAGLPSGFTKLTIGHTTSIDAHANCTIERVRYYPTRLSNTQLQALTA